LPNTWALTQLQISYASAFVKRGFLGEILRLLNVRSVRGVQAFCMLELAILLGLLAILTQRSKLLSAEKNSFLVCAFAGSYVVTFLGHLDGYHDIALYALAIAVVIIPKPRVRLAIAGPLCVVALLIHENFLLTALPTILLSFEVDRRSGRTAQMSWFRPAFLVILSLIVACGLSIQPSLSVEQLGRFKESVAAHSEYPVAPGVFDVLGMSTLSNMSLNLHVIAHNYWWWVESLVAFAVLGPILWLLLRASLEGIHERMYRVSILVAGLAPLALNVIAWDNVRWVALSGLSSYINLCVLSRREPTVAASHAPGESYAAILVLGLGLASGHGLMDRQSINPYPFFPKLIRSAVVSHDGVAGEVLGNDRE
jgi:hypothetical protein